VPRPHSPLGFDPQLSRSALRRAAKQITLSDAQGN
jgi:hypothetical protein